MKRFINEAEVPATNLERVEKFYSTILEGIEFHQMIRDEMQYTLFPSPAMFNAVAWVQGEYYQPSSYGATVYFNGSENYEPHSANTEKAGCEIIMPENFTGGEAGFVEMFINTEGNKTGLQHL